MARVRLIMIMTMLKNIDGDKNDDDEGDDDLGGRNSNLRAGVDVNPTMALAADRRAHCVCYT